MRNLIFINQEEIPTKPIDVIDQFAMEAVALSFPWLPMLPHCTSTLNIICRGM